MKSEHVVVVLLHHPRHPCLLLSYSFPHLLTYRQQCDDFDHEVQLLLQMTMIVYYCYYYYIENLLPSVVAWVVKVYNGLVYLVLLNNILTDVVDVAVFVVLLNIAVAIVTADAIVSADNCIVAVAVAAAFVAHYEIGIVFDSAAVVFVHVLLIVIVYHFFPPAAKDNS